MDIDIGENSKEYKLTHSVDNLGVLIQFIKIGMSRSEVEELLGKPTTYHPFAGSLYDIEGLRYPIDIDDGQSATMPVFLQVDYEGDEKRRQVALDAGDPESASQGELATDMLLAFAILPIGE